MSLATNPTVMSKAAYARIIEIRNLLDDFSVDLEDNPTNGEVEELDTYIGASCLHVEAARDSLDKFISLIEG